MIVGQAITKSMVAVRARGHLLGTRKPPFRSPLIAGPCLAPPFADFTEVSVKDPLEKDLLVGPGAFVLCATLPLPPQDIQYSLSLHGGGLSFLQAAGEDLALTGQGSFKGQGSQDSSVERAGHEQEPHCRLWYQYRGWVPSPLFPLCPRTPLRPKDSSIYHQHGNLALHRGIFSLFCALSCSSELSFHGGDL